MTLWPASDIVRPVADISGLIPHEAGRANSLLHDAFETLPISGAIGVQIEVTAGAVQPLLIVGRQLTGRRRQGG